MEENLNKTINKKKVIIIISIIIILLGICAFTVFYPNKKDSKTSKTFLVDNTFNLTVQKNYNLTEYKNSNNHILELHSKDNFNIYIDKLENLDNYSLFLIAKADRDYYPSIFESASSLSEIKELSINNFPSTNYSFNYLNNETSEIHYLQINFIKINNNIYTIDIEFPISKTEIFSPIVSDILSTISTDIK